MAITDFLNSIAPVVNLVAGLHGVSSANRAIKNNNVATPAETSQNALYAALADPNSPLLAQMADQDKAANLAAFQRQLLEMQLADRRNNAMGRNNTFFAPERSDEAISYLTSRGLPQMDAAARQSAQSRILAAASGYGGMVPQQAGRQQISMQQGISNAAYKTTLPQQIIDILNKPAAAQQPIPTASPPQAWESYVPYGQYAGYMPPKNNYNLTSNQMRFPV